MSRQTIVHGYIETFSEYDEYNNSMLTIYDYEEKPHCFLPIFSSVLPGFNSSIISFGYSYKNIHRVWGEWKKKFESLLGNLHAIAATVYVEDEDIPSESFSVVYAFQGDYSNLNVKGEKMWLVRKFDWQQKPASEEEQIVLWGPAGRP